MDYGKNLLVIRRQVFPGKSGLVTKPTKSRKERRVPILEPLRPVLERLTDGKQPEDSLLVGSEGGYLTTATVRDATNWDGIVAKLGLPDLTRHGLRTPGRPGWPTPVSRCTFCKTSSGTHRWRPPAAASTPTTGISPTAAEQANAFLSGAGQRKHARRSEPATRSLWRASTPRECRRRRSDPFWVPLSTGKRVEAGYSHTGRHLEPCRGPEGDHEKRSPDMMKPRRETYSHLGFYVGLTVSGFRRSFRSV